MPLRFKFILSKPANHDEIHVWEWNKPSDTLRLEEVLSAATELFGIPSRSHITFTVNDGEDDITISSTNELRHIVRDHIDATANTPFTKMKAIPMRLSVKHIEMNLTPAHVTEGTASPTKLQNTISTLIKEHVNGSVQMYSSTPRFALHTSVICNECDGYVCGIRYKCLHCPDYDLCAVCFDEDKHMEHPFIAVRLADGQYKQMKEVFRCIQMGLNSSVNSLGIQTQNVSADYVITGSCDTKISAQHGSNGTEEWEVLSDNSDSYFFSENGNRNALTDSSTHVINDDTAIGTVATQFENCEESYGVLIEPAATRLVELGVRGVMCELDKPVVVSEICAFEAPHSIHSAVTTSTCSSITSGVQADLRTSSAEGFDHANLLPPSHENHTQQPWNLTASMQNFIADAWKNLGFTRANKTAISMNELQILLDMGYSNEGGILTFLLAENNNNAAAVLEILHHQS